MECPLYTLTPKGSPVILRGFSTPDPPQLRLSTQERVQTISSQLLSIQNVETDPFTLYFIQFLKGPFNMDEAKRIISGPLADHYRKIAVDVLIDIPSQAYEFIKDVTNPLLKMELFEKISFKLAAVDSFDILVEGFKFLHRASSDLCKLKTAVIYLNMNNPYRAVQLYYLNSSIVHRKTLFQKFYALAPTLPDKIHVVNTIITFHYEREEIQQAVSLISECCHDINKDDLLFSLGQNLIKWGKHKHLPCVMNATPKRRAELEQLSTLQRRSKRKQPESELEATFLDPVVQQIMVNKPLGDLLASFRVSQSDKDRSTAFNTLVSLKRHQDAYYFAREISDLNLKESALSSLITTFVNTDNFALLKEIFPQCTNRDDIKLRTALLYLNSKPERAVEIFALLTSQRHRVELFSKMTCGKSVEVLNKIIGDILIPFLDSNDIPIAINIVKTQFSRIDIEFEIYRMGLYLVNNNKLSKIDLILNELSTHKESLKSAIGLKLGD